MSLPRDAKKEGRVTKGSAAYIYMPKRLRRGSLLHELRSLRYCTIVFGDEDLGQLLDTVEITSGGKAWKTQMPVFAGHDGSDQPLWRHSYEPYFHDLELQELMELTALLSLPRYMCNRDHYGAVFAANDDAYAKVWISERKLKLYIGQQDGTHVYLYTAPNHDMYPEAFYDTLHKGGYGYNVLLTSDHTGSIIHYALGWPGQTHDATIQMHLDMYHNPWNYFEKGQYIFVDTGFSRQMWSVPPYKGKSALLEHNAHFNKAMRRGRCRIEHVNARLKGRFGSLKSIPIKIQSVSDHERANRWIRACIVLHNFWIRVADEWVFTYKAKQEVVEETENDECDDVTGCEFQDMVRDRWLRMQGWS